MISLRLLLLAGLLLLAVNLSGQCLPAGLANPTCGTGSTVSSNSNINNGTTFNHCTANTSMTNINLNGGTLQVCGILTLSSANFNSGNIVVAKYGELIINQNVTLNNNITICNYGTLTINGTLTFQNSNNYLINAASDARMVISGTVTFSNNSNQEGYIVNRGHLQCGGMNVRDGAQYICLETGSYLGINGSLDYNISSANNVFTYGSGSSGNATIRYTGNAFLSNNSSKTITSSSRILICKATGATQSGTGGWGVPAGNISTNCGATAQPQQTGVFISCFTLPVEWLSWSATPEPGALNILWSTASEVNSSYFVVELTGGDNLLLSPPIEAAGNSHLPQYYSVKMPAAPGAYYIRIRQVDFDGQVNYSPYFTATVQESSASMVAPNPFTDALNVTAAGENIRLLLRDAQGKLLLSEQLGAGPNSISTSALAAGIYFAEIQDAGGQTMSRSKMVKQ